MLHEIVRPIKIISGRPIEDFEFNYYSQHGEDGIVQEILRRLGVKNGWVVEFGAWDGKYLSNTFRLLEKGKGFKAVFIEGEKDRYEDLVILSKKMNDRIIPLCAFVEPDGENSLDNLLARTPIPEDIDLLSIDVDGMDYHIWEGVKKYNPKVVIIEVNCSLPLELEQKHDAKQKKQGSSFLSTLKLGNDKGYTCVYHHGNMFFVKDDLMSKAGLEVKTFEQQKGLYKRKN